MVQVASGSPTAFSDLVHRHQKNLLNFFTRLGVYNDAEDMVQETFVRVYRSREKYRPTAKFTTFLYVLARHVWADRGRQHMRRERLQDSLQTDAEVLRGGPAPRRGRKMDIEAALDSLSPKLREVIVLNVYQGLRYQEVADVLGIPLGTVKSRISLALQELRKVLDD